MSIAPFVRLLFVIYKCFFFIGDNYMYVLARDTTYLVIIIILTLQSVLDYNFVTEMLFSLCCSHLLGFFYRTIRMVENGIKPV